MHTADPPRGFTPTSSRHVVLCDEGGQPLRTCDINQAHRHPGELHLAFSIYLFSPNRRSLLIQQRSPSKPLWPGIWANTCCSHPQWGEDAISAGRRRLLEELGIDTPLTQGPGFVYRAEEPSGRGVEHEYDLLLHGTFDRSPSPNPLEVTAWRWVALDELTSLLRHQPHQFAPWLHLGLPRLLAHLQQI